MPSLRSSVTTLGVFLSGLTYGAPGLVERAAGCNADNALRALRATQRAAVATPFCRAYISIPTDTVTVATTTPLTSTSTTATVKETITSVSLVTETILETTTLDNGAVVTVTVTETPVHAVERRTAVPIPDFISQYPEDRISSACSCLDLPRETTFVTYTAPISTILKLATTTQTVTVSTTQTAETTLTTSTTNPPTTVTQTISLPKPTSFHLLVTYGSHTGQYVSSIVLDDLHSFLTYTPDVTQARVFYFGFDGTLHYIETSLSSGIPTDFVDYFVNGDSQDPLTFIESDKLDPAHCTSCYSPHFELDENNVLAAINEQDSSGVNPSLIETCGYPDSIVYLGTSLGQYCEDVTLVAIAA